jgi:hypothetical protein
MVVTPNSSDTSNVNYDRLKSDITDQVRGELMQEVSEMIKRQNSQVASELIGMRQSIQGDSGDGLEGNEMANLLNQHMRDITREPRPQMSSSGLGIHNQHFKDLTNHELHQVKRIHEKDHTKKPKTILDEPLGSIMDKLVNFLTYSFDGYTKAYYEAETMEDAYDNEKSTYQMIKVHLIAIILFMRSDQNILYIGILLVLLSIIIYLVNITTS